MEPKSLQSPEYQSPEERPPIDWRRALSILCLCIGVFHLGAGILLLSVPGGYVSTWLLGILWCASAQVLSHGQTIRIVAFVFIILFLGLAQLDHDQGMEYTESRVRKSVKQAAPATILSPSSSTENGARKTGQLLMPST